LQARRGALELTADAGGAIVLLAPPDIGCRGVARVVLGLEPSLDGMLAIDVAASIDARWTRIAHASLASLTRTPAGLVADCDGAGAYRLRITLSIAPRARVPLTRIAILQN
jgi:hypothetical protein